MYTLFLKIATRYLLKNKLYSFINIFGLAIGIASFVLIMLYVNYEESYDKFEGSENIHRVYMDYLEGDEYVPGDANAYIVSGPTLIDEFPEIQDFVRLRRVSGLVLLHDNIVFDNQAGALADPSYFNIFDRSLEKGDIQTALNEPYSMVLSAALAKKIFGEANPIGKSLKIAGGGDTLFKVTGVLNSDVPNSHINNDFLVSFKTFYTWPAFEQDWQYTWNQNEYYTYLKIDENADIELLNQKVMAFEPEGLKNERHHLEPIEDIHLYSNKPYEAEANGSGSSVKLLAIIAFITILLSWMNYVNLSTSKSLERAKEIGVRKIVGARRPQFILQSFIESGLLNIIAIAFQIFTVLAILIASMGLFGLTSYTVVQRKKEIGIRKVNGATVPQILQLLNKDFVKWVGIAFLAAVPISWFAMDKWLEGFAYRTEISWWIFALAGMTALGIAFLTVTWQSLQAANANPVDSLRDE